MVPRVLAEPASRHERRNEYTLLPLVVTEDPTRFAASLRPFCHGPNGAPLGGCGTCTRLSPQRTVTWPLLCVHLQTLDVGHAGCRLVPPYAGRDDDGRLLPIEYDYEND